MCFALSSKRGGLPLKHRVVSIVKEMHRLRAALKVADRSLARISRHVIVMNAGSGGNGGYRRRLSPKARASLVLQGRYMGFMRQLRPRQKAQVRKIKEAKGVRGAIQRARELSQV